MSKTTIEKHVSTLRFKRILVPTDFGRGADAALDTAIELAREFGATVVLMHAYGVASYDYLATAGLATADYVTALEHAARDALKSAVAARKDADVPIASALYCGVPWEQVLVAIEQHGIGLVIMGTHGRRGFARALLGSVAEKVVRFSPVPVLTLRGLLEPA